jgi:hypothetical protein
VLLFSLIVLGISANFIHLSNLADGSFIVFEALAVAVALLVRHLLRFSQTDSDTSSLLQTFITIIPMYVHAGCRPLSLRLMPNFLRRLVIDFLRKGAFTSLVVFELGWVCKSRLSGISQVTPLRLSTVILMVLWIAAAADTSSTSLFVGGCSGFEGTHSPLRQIVTQRNSPLCRRAINLPPISSHPGVLLADIHYP